MPKWAKDTCQNQHGFEYYRHGTLSLYAALDVKTAKAHGMTGTAPYQSAVHRIPGWVGEANSRERNLRGTGQSFRAQDHGCRAFSGSTSARAVAFHPDIFVVLNRVELWFAKIDAT